jgi:drug/metabolite transporter (DMT)-like permease
VNQARHSTTLDPSGEPCTTPVVNADTVPEPLHAAAPSRGLVVLALLMVYIVWGSTYLAIRFALDGYAPLFMPALRFLAAGAILFAVMCLRGAALPTARQWRNAALIGVLLLGGGNGCVVFAERWVGSGLAATAVAAVPLWAAVFGSLRGFVPTRLQWLGLAVGFAGIVILNLGGDLSGNWMAALLLIVAPISWAYGSVLSKRIDLPAGLMNPAAQMITGGALFLLASAIAGEHWTLAASPRAIASVAYLAIFGSVTAYSAYIFLVHNTTPALATSYAYVNPLVAVLLGLLFAGETVTTVGVVAMGLVLGGVALIVAFDSQHSH